MWVGMVLIKGNMFRKARDNLFVASCRAATRIQDVQNDICIFNSSPCTCDTYTFNFTVGLLIVPLLLTVAT